MAVLTGDKRNELARATRESAIAFVQDIDHLRGALQTDLAPADIRRFAVIARRLLVESNLSDIAAPRTGKLELLAPDLKAFYRHNDKAPYEFFAGSPTSMLGAKFAFTEFNKIRQMRPADRPDPEQRISLRLEAFTNQRVMCRKGVWVTRRDVIKYVSYAMAAVHPSATRPEDKRPFAILDELRKLIRWRVQNHGEGQTLTIQLGMQPVLPFSLTDKAIDPVLLELFATLQFVVQSPDVTALEKAIIEEVG